MQIYAKDTQNRIIPAHKALKTEKYFCLECQERVGIRKSFRRRIHFFHYNYHRICKTSGKSLVHLQVQNAIKDILHGEEIVLEKYFLEIKRIADVCWERKKIIFEIQCSYITKEEVASRIQDYKQLGYQVIWILHDNRYNQKNKSEVELFLQKHPHYYTNINIYKKGIIYDLLNKKKYAIDLNNFYFSETTSNLPVIIEREQFWGIYFKGDLLDSFYRKNLRMHEINFLKKSFINKSQFILFKKGIKMIAEIYKVFIDFILEVSCK